MADHSDFFDAFGASPAPTGRSPAPPISYQQPKGHDDFFDAFGKGTTAPPEKSVLKDVAKQAGAAAIEGPIMATVGAPGDIAESSKPGGVFDKAELALIHKLQDWTGYGPQAGTPERAKLDKDFAGARELTNVPLPATPTTHGILDAAGVQLPDPETAPGRYTRMAGDFAAGAVTGNAPAIVARGMEAGGAAAARAAASAAKSGLLPGVGAQAATDAAESVDPDLAPLGQFVGGPAAHVVGAGGARAARGVVHSAPVAGALDRVGVSGPAQTRAARQFIDAATDPAAVREQLANPVNPEGAPGTQFASISAPNADGAPIFAQPTTPELTQDPGLMIAQRADMAKNTAEYLPQMAQNNEARIRYMQGDQSADPTAVSTYLRDNLDAIHSDADAKLEQARSDAQAKIDEAQATAQTGVDAASTAGDARVADVDQSTQAGIDQAQAAATAAHEPIQSVQPEILGERMRQPLADLNAEAKAREGALHEAIDPDNSLVASTVPIRTAARGIYGALSKAAQASLSGPEKDFIKLISEYKSRESYREVADLSSDLGAKMRAEKWNNQGVTPAYRRMTLLMNAVKDSLHNTVSELHAAEADAVASGRMGENETAAARMRVVGGSDFPGDWPAPLFDQVAPKSVTAAQRGPKPASLVSFLQRAGGIQDQGGNLAAAGHDRYPGLVTRNGLPLDRAREMAAEAGYLGADTEHAVSNTDVNDLLDAIGSHPSYSVHDQDVVMDRAQRAQEVAHQKDFGDRRRDIADTLKRDHGFQEGDFDDRLLNQAAHIAMEDGRASLDAYELAITRQLDHDLAASRAAKEAVAAIGLSFDGMFNERSGEGSGRRGARGAQVGNADTEGRQTRQSPANGQESAPRGEGAGVSEATADRIKAANQATRERKATFEKGHVGQVLRPGPVAGEYRVSESAVPAKLFQAGPKGLDAVRGYFDAVGDHADAANAMRTAATNELAKIVDKNGGQLTEAGLRAWKHRYSDALRGIEERSPGFSSKFDNAARATAEVERLTGERRGAVREAEKARSESVRDAERAGAAAVKEAGRQGAATVKETEMQARQASKDFQQGVVKNLLESRNPESVVAHLKTLIGDEKNGVREAERLSKAVEGNAEAQEALRAATAKAFSERITSKVRILNSDTPTVKAGARSDLDKAMPVLEKLLTPEHVAMIRRAITDAARQETLMSGTKLPGGSNTAQDTAAGAKHGGGRGKSITHGGALTLGGIAFYAYEHGGAHIIGQIPMGAGLAVGAVAGFRMLKRMGVDSTQKYFEQMIRNPEFAAQMVKRVSPTYDARQTRITGLIRKALTQGGRRDDDGRNTPPADGPFAARQTETNPGAGGEQVENPSNAGAKIDMDERGRIEPTMAPVAVDTAQGTRAAPVTVEKTGDIEAARSQVASDATEAQMAAGNHKMGHAVVDGLPITIERPRGSFRTGTSPDGVKWAGQMPADYGYIKKTTGADGDHVDVYVGRRAPNGRAFVVDQIDPRTGSFDENKVFLGVGSADEAAALYKRAFSDGSGEKRMGNIVEMPVADLKEALQRNTRGQSLASDDGTIRNPHPAAGAPANLQVMKKQTLAEALGELPASTAPFQRQLAARLAKLTGDTSVSIISGQEAAKIHHPSLPEPGVGGLYMRANDHILMNADELAHPATAASTILHEGVHAGVMHLIDGDQNVRGWLDHFIAATPYSGAKPYGLSNAHEFFSEAMTNPQFRQTLKDAPPTPESTKAFGGQDKSSMWLHVVSLVRRALGLPARTESLLDHVMSFADRTFERAESPFWREIKSRLNDGANAASPMTPRAADLAPDMSSKAREIIEKAGPDLKKADISAPLASKMIGLALAPKLDPRDPAFGEAFRTLEAKGGFMSKEAGVADREMSFLRGQVQRAYRLTADQTAAMSRSEVLGHAFAQFANSRNEEGGEGLTLHVGVRRPFERMLEMFAGLQAVGNRMGFYRPHDFAAARPNRSLTPNEPGEAFAA